MDSDTLHTASTYLNNLLLARGLLRNGKALDFAKPTRDTRAQVINLVHDLLLRRDKEQEGREQAALILRSLRAEQTRKDGEIERLQTRLAEKDRALVQAQTEARNAKAEMRKTEANAKGLQDHVVRLKTMVGQVKTQCTNDVKKRDLQIERLRSHLQGQQRGNKSNIVAPTINITGGSGVTRCGTAFNASVRELQDPEYSLKQETNEFLTQLSQSLSDENDGLIALVRGTLATLKESLGLPETTSRACDSTTGSMESVHGLDTSLSSSIMVMSYEQLASELGATVATLKTLLTSPNFVSVEEVDIRDEEIARLREGWERMETRWKEVLFMMDGWRTRMEKTGDTINLDDLRKGLGLGVGFDTMTYAEPDQSEHDVHLSDEGLDADSDSGVDNTDVGETKKRPEAQDAPPDVAAIEPPGFFDLRPARTRTLRPRSINLLSPRKVAFAVEAVSEKKAAQESRFEEEAENARLLETPTIDKPKKQRAARKAAEILAQDVDERHLSQVSTLGILNAIAVLTTKQSRKRHSSPRPLSTEPGPKYPAQGNHDVTSSSFVEEDVPNLTVEEKLHAAQEEAEEAVRAPATCTAAVDDENTQADLELADEITQLRSPAKKSKIKGRPRRRKSTLSPEELESLLGFD